MKNKSLAKRVTALLGAALLLSLFQAQALEFFADEDHKGVIKLSNDLSIFPENRVSNAFYLKGQLVKAENGKTIHDVVSVQDGYVYSVSGADKSVSLVPLLSKEYSISRIEGDGLLLRETSESEIILFYAASDAKIMRLPLSYKSSGGFSVHPNGSVVFFFINSFSGKPPDRVFDLVVNVYRHETKAIETLPDIVQNKEAKLDFKWLDEKTISYSTVSAKNLKISLK